MVPPIALSALGEIEPIELADEHMAFGDEPKPPAELVAVAMPSNSKPIFELIEPTFIEPA